MYHQQRQSTNTVEDVTGGTEKKDSKMRQLEEAVVAAVSKREREKGIQAASVQSVRQIKKSSQQEMETLNMY